MCVFVGYSADQHAYLYLDPSTGRIYTSRHVKFVENEFPFRTLVTPSSSPNEPQTTPLQLPVLPSIPAPTARTNPTLPVAPHSPSFPHSPHLAQTSSSNDFNHPEPSHDVSSPSPHSSPSPESQPTTVSPSPPPQPTIPPNNGGIITRSKNNIVKPIQKLNLHVRPSQPVEPSTITQALRDPDWRFAMQNEFDALHRNNTWDLVSRSSAPNLVGCKWVF
jgi:histone deacetylase 1/2